MVKLSFFRYLLLLLLAREENKKSQKKKKKLIALTRLIFYRFAIKNFRSIKFEGKVTMGRSEKLVKRIVGNDVELPLFSDARFKYSSKETQMISIDFD